MNEKTVKDWIIKAESDLKTGKDEVATENPATDAICFHMQQCAEKYLKAYIIFNGKEIRKTHNIAEIIRNCIEIEPEFQQLFEIKAQILTGFAIEFRYPGDVLFPSLQETNEAIEIAEKIKSFVLEKLKGKSFRP